MSLSDFSKLELKEELERREKEEKEKNLPRPREDMDWKPLVNYLQIGVKSKNDGRGEPKDFRYYVFELAMEIVYGHDIWKWWNNLR